MCPWGCCHSTTLHVTANPSGPRVLLDRTNERGSDLSCKFVGIRPVVTKAPGANLFSERLKASPRLIVLVGLACGDAVRIPVDESKHRYLLGHGIVELF